METVIYGDVLVAVNFIINLMILGLTRKLTGIPVKRYRRYIGALAGALASFIIFVPVQGIAAELFIRAATTALVIGVTYWGQTLKMMLRLSAVFFTVGFILAGFVMGIWFLLPSDLMTFRSGVYYLNVTPIVLLGCVAAAYLFVSIFDRVFDGGQGRDGVWQAVVSRAGRTVRLQLFMDTGNQLVEPFSGLPVMVVGIQGIAGLLNAEETDYITTGVGEIPRGLRPVFFSGVGAEGLLCAFKPETMLLQREGRTICCEGYLAVSVKELACQGCSGVFNPRLVGIGR